MPTMEQHLFLNGQKVPYIMKRLLRSRSLRLRMDSEGVLYVTRPYFVSEKKALHFIHEKSEWILKQHDAVEQHKKKQSIEDGTVLTFFDGTELSIQLREGMIQGYILTSSGLILPANISKKEQRKLLGDALLVFARKYLLNQLERSLAEIADEVGRRVTKVQIKHIKSRWGSCTSKGVISLSLRLLLFPENVVRYVMIHEVCHLLEMNHSKHFWEHVARLCPEYKEMKKTLHFPHSKNGEAYGILL